MNYVRACTHIAPWHTNTTTNIFTYTYKQTHHNLLFIVSLILLDFFPFVCSIEFYSFSATLTFMFSNGWRRVLCCLLLWPTFDFMIDCSMAFSSHSVRHHKCLHLTWWYKTKKIHPTQSGIAKNKLHSSNRSVAIINLFLQRVHDDWEERFIRIKSKLLTRSAQEWSINANWQIHLLCAQKNRFLYLTLSWNDADSL